jgi:hypothetical protein
MRLIVLCLVWAWLASSAAAQGCGDLRPRFLYDRPAETRDYLRCLEDEVARLKRDQARQAEALEAQARALAAIPADYANTDGRVTEVPGRPVGRAVFVLSSRRGDADASLALDRGVIEALCSRPGGCAITLAHQALGFGFGNPRETTGIGPCLFARDEAGGAWYRGETCGGPALRGIDGDGGATGTSGGAGSSGGEVIVEVAGACLLADADSGRKAAADGPALARDSGPGLFLIAATTGDGGERFRCELRIE